MDTVVVDIDDTLIDTLRREVGYFMLKSYASLKKLTFHSYHVSQSGKYYDRSLCS